MSHYECRHCDQPMHLGPCETTEMREEARNAELARTHARTLFEEEQRLKRIAEANEFFKKFDRDGKPLKAKAA